MMHFQSIPDIGQLSSNGYTVKEKKHMSVIC